MNKTIWKFEIPRGVDSFTLDLPVGHKVVHVAQGFMWIEGVFPIEEGFRVQRTYEVRGTGNPVPDRVEYIGTWFQHPFVWHLFEVF